jgi:hypothetical protein
VTRSIFNGSNNSCVGTLTGENNLSDGTCPGTLGAVTNLDSTLQDNGGPTWTHALLNGSNAIDAVVGDCTNPVSGEVIDKDQRGTLRNDGQCDIGAFEYIKMASLSIPSDIPAYTGMVVTVPVTFTSNSSQVAASTFSVDFDETNLSFDPTDSDNNGIPDSVTFDNLPADFNLQSVSFDSRDSDGQLDIAIADTSPPFATLPDTIVASIGFTVTRPNPGPGINVTAPISFGNSPSASFGDPNAQDVLGKTVDGSVEILGFMVGDPNGDGIVNAADIIGLALEIFDGDGDDPAGTGAGTFSSNPGADANQNGTVDAGDVSCLYCSSLKAHVTRQFVR